MTQSTALFLRTHRRVFIDTNVLIHLVEGTPEHEKDCDIVFQRIESGKNDASTSTLTLLEILVRPYRLGRDDLVNRFYALFTTYPNLVWRELTTKTADIAAKLRAKYGLKTPDAIQAATALSHNISAFITCDKDFLKIPDLHCHLLETS